MKHCLRIIKRKTKIYIDFKGIKIRERFDNIMIISKSAKLRSLKPLFFIKKISRQIFICLIFSCKKDELIKTRLFTL